VYLILSVGIVFPVAFAIAIKAVLFDGMRHFIFVLPLAAVASALVASQGLTRLGRFRYRKPIYAVIALYCIAHISVMAMLHPDQYVYYNSFVGGVAGAEQKFKLDYWANSYAEAVQGLEDYLRAAYGPDFEEREFTVAVCGPPISADYYFPANFRFTRQLSRADFLSRLPRIIVTVRCLADRSTESSVWARCCRLCSIGATALPEADGTAAFGRRAVKTPTGTRPAMTLEPLLFTCTQE